MGIYKETGSLGIFLGKPPIGNFTTWAHDLVICIGFWAVMVNALCKFVAYSRRANVAHIYAQ
jgi:hypothetical protein